MDAGMTPRPRTHIRNRYVLLGDLALIIVSVMGSFALRLDVGQLPFYFPAILMMTSIPMSWLPGRHLILLLYFMFLKSILSRSPSMVLTKPICPPQDYQKCTIVLPA